MLGGREGGEGKGGCKGVWLEEEGDMGEGEKKGGCCDRSLSYAFVWQCLRAMHSEAFALSTSLFFF